ncbi:MAG: O-methyltransferase [Phycisphaerae bacterium]|nr:O-methyltransferase [Gemmatimonadaceae bacterium]
MSAEETWTNVDEYFSSLFVGTDAALSLALSASTDAGLPEIAVAPNQGKLLHLLVRMSGAKRVLEIGTLGGYSTIWMARALPKNGQLVTLELDETHAKVAQANFERAGLEKVIELRRAAAVNSLQELLIEGVAPFDFVFIDADKANIPRYFEFALKLTRVGSVIIVDNVVRDGKVVDAASTDASIVGVRKFNEMVAMEPRVSATALQTVGTKGYDGLAIMLVVDATHA